MQTSTGTLSCDLVLSASERDQLLHIGLEIKSYKMRKWICKTDLEIKKVSKDRTEWALKKDPYTTFSQCFHSNNSREWFCLDKNGKKCLKLSARAACNVDNSTYAS